MASRKSRPVLVKFHSIWSRRLVLSNSRVLASCADYMHDVFIHADQPLEERRKMTLKQLRRKAKREHKSIVLSEDETQLFIDGVLVFTLSDGFVRQDSAGSSVNSRSNDHGC